jgi:hypothetical protein
MMKRSSLQRFGPIGGRGWKPQRLGKKNPRKKHFCNLFSKTRDFFSKLLIMSMLQELLDVQVPHCWSVAADEESGSGGRSLTIAGA